MMPKVETFEHNIAEEIKRKEATAAEIAAASAEAAKADALPKENLDGISQKKEYRTLLIIIGFAALIVILIAGLAFYYFSGKATGPIAVQNEIYDNSLAKATGTLHQLSPTMEKEIGRFLVKVEESPKGYAFTFDTFAPVFGYVSRNESAYIGELARSPLLFRIDTTPKTSTASSSLTASSTPSAEKASTTQTVSTGTTTKATATSSSATSTKTTSSKTATSTSKTSKATTTSATSTKTTTPATTTLDLATTTGLLKPAEPIPFSDVTISNQNIRVWKSKDQTIVYAFVNEKILIISNSVENLLALKSVILK